jgi:hypothetical protein
VDHWRINRSRIRYPKPSLQINFPKHSAGIGVSPHLNQNTSKETLKTLKTQKTQNVAKHNQKMRKSASVANYSKHRPHTGLPIKGSRLREKYRNKYKQEDIQTKHKKEEGMIPASTPPTLEIQSSTPSIFYKDLKSFKALKRDHKRYLRYFMKNIGEVVEEAKHDKKVIKGIENSIYSKNDLGTITNIYYLSYSDV